MPARFRFRSSPFVHAVDAVVAFIACVACVAGVTLAGCASTTMAPPTQTAPSTSTSLAPLETQLETQPYAPASFAKAKAEHRLVLLTLVTQWCHWCHVMDEKTWADPAFAALMRERFVVIRVDADSRPDLAERYAAWGWPALALLTPDAAPVMEWRGYQDAHRFAGELRGYLADFDAGRTLARTSSTETAPLQPLQAMRDFTRAQLDGFYDDAVGGWGKSQKYPLWAPVADALFRGRMNHDAAALARAKQTLDGELLLIDRVDGGMFQYSVDGVWSAPHFEKLAEVNGTALENFADAYATFHDDAYRAAALDLARYLRTVLRRDDGAFFANQDADVGTRGERPLVLGRDYYAKDAAGRRATGAPFVDTHVYASHNGRVIAGLARLAAVAGDNDVLAAATAAAAVIDAHLAVDVGPGFVGYRHSEEDAATPKQTGSAGRVFHLADQLAMGRAHALLAEATGLPIHRARALAIARFVQARCADPDGGFVGVVDETAGAGDGVFADRRKPFRQNGEAARLLLLVGRLEGDASLVTSAERALAAVSSPSVIGAEYRMVGEVLLASEELLTEPLHFAVVGDSADPRLRALLAAVNATATPHRLVDVQAPGKSYPDLKKPALYVCGASFCSAPVFEPARVAAVVDDSLAR